MQATKKLGKGSLQHLVFARLGIWQAGTGVCKREGEQETESGKKNHSRLATISSRGTTTAACQFLGAPPRQAISSRRETGRGQAGTHRGAARGRQATASAPASADRRAATNKSTILCQQHEMQAATAHNSPATILMLHRQAAGHTPKLIMHRVMPAPRGGATQRGPAPSSGHVRHARTSTPVVHLFALGRPAARPSGAAAAAPAGPGPPPHWPRCTGHPGRKSSMPSSRGTSAGQQPA